VTFRSTAAFTAAALGAAALLAIPATAQAQAAPPSGTPTITSLGITSSVQDMVVAGGKIWVSTGNEVDVFSTAGKKLKTITALLGADGLLASADGTQVYVALSQDSRIITVDASSLDQVANWPTSGGTRQRPDRSVACSGHLARREAGHRGLGSAVHHR